MAEPSMNSSDREEVKKLIAQEAKRLYGQEPIPVVIRGEKTRFPTWAKESAGFAVVMAGAAFIVSSYIPAQIGNQTRQMGEDISGLKASVGTVQHDVGEIKTDLKDAINKAFNRALDGLQSRSSTHSSAKGTNRQEQAAFEQSASALRFANAMNLEIDRQVWEKAQSGLRFRSILNASLPSLPSLAGAKRFIGNSFFFELKSVRPFPPEVEVGTNTVGLLWTLGDDVPIHHAARVEAIGSKANEKFKYGPKMIIYESPYGIKLDGMWLKNVVVRNTEVVYARGQVRLDNVFFVNCSFQLANSIPARQLAQRVFESSPVSLSSD